MADDKGGETIRSIISGFNLMQQQLGLLPGQSGTMPMGVPMNQGPPMMAMPHPSEAAMQISQQQQAMMQQTIQQAQQTRYQPPPSAPASATWASSYAQMGAGQFNPQVANALGGGMGQGMPNPIYSTAPQYGMYRPGGHMGGGVRMPGIQPPAIFNPFAAQIPAPHFMTPAMQSYQIMQGREAQGIGMIGGMLEGGLDFGGSLLGGAIGGMFGGFAGGIAGSYVGGRVGQFASDMSIGPAFSDVRRGRQMQQMSAPWMVSGASLNPFTGQGLSREAGRDLATSMRTMTRDHDFQRTGFNTQDVMQITQLASDQGLLQTAQNPDEIARKVKDISRSIKALIQITGDPDVRNAISHLGQMRGLGFEGLSGQMGAVANRASMARMAGVSQAGMHDMFGMPGAMMAQGLGLAGATGYTAGMGGGGLGNIGVSSGSFSDLQLARAGGKQGLGQMNAMAALGAINQDVFLGAAIKVGANGQIDVDPEAYKRATSGSVGDAAREMGSRMGRLSPTQLMSYGRMQGELKDKLAQTMSPVDMHLNAIRQAKALMAEDKNLDLGGALQVMTGGNSEAARALELEWTSNTFYKGLQQQLQVQKRDAADRTRAGRERFRTPGLMRNVANGIGDIAEDISDGMVNPVRTLMERSSRIDEDIAAQARGESVRRYSRSSLIENNRDREAALGAMNTDLASAYGSMGQDPRAAGRWGNRIGAAFGLTDYNDANNAVAIANRNQGGFLGFNTSFGDVNSAMDSVGRIRTAAQRIQEAQGMSSSQTVAGLMQLQKSGAALGGGFDARAVVSGAARSMASDKDFKTSYLAGAGQAGGTDSAQFEKHMIASLVGNGNIKTEDDARAFLNSGNNRSTLMTQMAHEMLISGNQKTAEVLMNTSANAASANSFKGRQGELGWEKWSKGEFAKIGLEDGVFDHKGYEQTKMFIKNNDATTMAFVGALAASKDDPAGTAHVLKQLEASFGTSEAGQQKLQDIKERAAAIYGGASDDTKKSLGSMFSRGGDKALDSFRQAKHIIDSGMAVQGTASALKRMETASGATGLQDMASVESAAMALKPEELETLTKKDAGLGAAIKAYRNNAPGSLQALRRAALDRGASGTSEVVGGDQQGSEGIDRQKSEIESLRKELGTDKVISDLAKVTGDLRAVTDTLTQRATNPLIPNPNGGF